MEKLLSVEDLRVRFHTDEGAYFAVDGVSFDLSPGEVVGLVGESGCGKSVTALSLVRLIPLPSGQIVSGRIQFKEMDLLALPPSRMRRIRGKSIGMIFQEPSAALSPLRRIGDQMVESLKLHNPVSKQQALETARQWLKRVGIPEPGQRLSAWPFQLSGGMQQRVMIAMALMMEPDLLIADEPTTALDVTIQAQVFDLIQRMKSKDTAILLITHDMGVVWDMCSRVLVMYAGKIVEQGDRDAIFNTPAHPYTRGLLKSIPRLGGNPQELSAIAGMVPSPLNYPSGCRFHDRCDHRIPRCQDEMPPFYDCGHGHLSACFLAHQFV